jgi:hypothetical protein
MTKSYVRTPQRLVLRYLYWNSSAVEARRCRRPIQRQQLASIDVPHHHYYKQGYRLTDNNISSSNSSGRQPNGDD